MDEKAYARDSPAGGKRAGQSNPLFFNAAPLMPTRKFARYRGYRPALKYEAINGLIIFFKKKEYVIIVPEHGT